MDSGVSSDMDAGTPNPAWQARLRLRAGMRALTQEEQDYLRRLLERF